jgi:hypothetical protein
MGLRIQNNIAAFNAHRNLKVADADYQNPWKNCLQVLELTKHLMMLPDLLYL